MKEQRKKENQKARDSHRYADFDCSPKQETDGTGEADSTVNKKESSKNNLFNVKSWKIWWVSNTDNLSSGIPPSLYDQIAGPNGPSAAVPDVRDCILPTTLSLSSS